MLLFNIMVLIWEKYTEKECFWFLILFFILHIFYSFLALKYVIFIVRILFLKHILNKMTVLLTQSPKIFRLPLVFFLVKYSINLFSFFFQSYKELLIFYSNSPPNNQILMYCTILRIDFWWFGEKIKYLTWKAKNFIFQKKIIFFIPKKKQSKF